MLTEIWLDGDSAPRDGTVFLGDFGWSWAVSTVWSEVDGKWVYALPQADPTGSDRYFENEWEESENLRRWSPIPEL